jgi:hypothetical protein
VQVNKSSGDVASGCSESEGARNCKIVGCGAEKYAIVGDCTRHMSMTTVPRPYIQLIWSTVMVDSPMFSSMNRACRKPANPPTPVLGVGVFLGYEIPTLTHSGDPYS